jgi:hypothetical protein
VAPGLLSAGQTAVDMASLLYELSVEVLGNLLAHIDRKGRSNHWLELGLVLQARLS